MLSKWLVVVSGPQAVEELRQARDDELSFMDIVVEVCSQACYGTGPWY